MEQSDVEDHIERFSPNRTVSCVDRRVEHAGWSLVCSRKVRRGEELLHVAWENVLDLHKCIDFWRSIVAAMQEEEEEKDNCNDDDEAGVTFVAKKQSLPRSSLLVPSGATSTAPTVIACTTPAKKKRTPTVAEPLATLRCPLIIKHGQEVASMMHFLETSPIEFVMAVTLISARSWHHSDVNYSWQLLELPRWANKLYQKPGGGKKSVLRHHRVDAIADRFFNGFGWAYRVMESLGDLGIPLCWWGHDAKGGSVSRFETCEQDALVQAWSCDETLTRRVCDDARHMLALQREWLDSFWFNSTPTPEEAKHASATEETLYGEEDEQLRRHTLKIGQLRRYIGGDSDVFLRVVAWIRSRWLSYAAPSASSGSSSLCTCPSKAGSMKRAAEYAVCPLIEKLNHHSDSVMCPTVEQGAYVSLIADMAKSSPNQLGEGDEVYISYGPLTNIHLFERYGFVVPTTQNPADTIELVLPEVEDSVLDKWCVAHSCITRSWKCSSSGGAFRAPVPVQFAIAMSCLNTLEKDGLIQCPVDAGVSNDSQADDVDNMCFGFGGDNEDEDSENGGGTWFYDEGRMSSFLFKHGTVLLNAVLKMLTHLIILQVIRPAERVLQCVGHVTELADATEDDKALNNSWSTSIFWARRFAQQRAALGTLMLAENQ